MEEELSRCRRCNRVLHREPYKSLGIGEICATKEGITIVHEKAKADGLLIESEEDQQVKKKKKIKRHYGASTPTPYNEFQLELNLHERNEK